MLGGALGRKLKSCGAVCAPGLMGPAVTRDCEDSRDPERSRSKRLGTALKRVVYVKGLMRSFFECSMIFDRADCPAGPSATVVFIIWIMFTVAAF